jgi:hypothetical protein
MQECKKTPPAASGTPETDRPYYVSERNFILAECGNSQADSFTGIVKVFLVDLTTL